VNLWDEDRMRERRFRVDDHEAGRPWVSAIVVFVCLAFFLWYARQELAAWLP